LGVWDILVAEFGDRAFLRFCNLPCLGRGLSSGSAIFAWQALRLASCPLPGFPAKQPSMAACRRQTSCLPAGSGQSSRRTCDGTSKSPSGKHPSPLRQRPRKDWNSVFYLLITEQRWSVDVFILLICADYSYRIRNREASPEDGASY